MERKAMKNTEKPRAALFTVRDAEDALVRLILILFLILGGIILHERILDGQTWSAAFYVMLEPGGDALAWATSINLFVEGGMIMFSRLQDHRDRRKRRFAEARAEGIAKGKAEVYQKIAEWNNRRLDAETHNEPFTEPFPEPPDTTDT